MPAIRSFAFNDALSERLASETVILSQTLQLSRVCGYSEMGWDGAVRLRELGGLGVVSRPSQGASSMETQLAEQDSHQSTNKRQAGLCLRTGRTVTRSRQPIASPQWPISTNGPFLQPITGEQPCCDIIL